MTASTLFKEDLGQRAFLGQRSTRLLIPLVFGMLVIVPPQSYFEIVEKLRYAGGGSPSSIGATSRVFMDSAVAPIA